MRSGRCSLTHTQLSEKATVVHTAPPANRQSKATRPRVTQLWSPATQTLKAAADPGFRPHLPRRPWRTAQGSTRARSSSRRRLPGVPRAGVRRAPPPAPAAGPPHPGTDARQPPRLWHYGHGGGDGSAEAEPAGHEGAGIVSAAFLSRTRRRRAGPGRGRAGASGCGVGASRSRDTRPALPEPPSALEACEARGPGGVRRGPGLEPVPGRCPAVTGDRTGVRPRVPPPASPAGSTAQLRSAQPWPRTSLAARWSAPAGLSVQPDAGGDRWLLPRLFCLCHHSLRLPHGCSPVRRVFATRLRLVPVPCHSFRVSLQIRADNSRSGLIITDRKSPLMSLFSRAPVGSTLVLLTICKPGMHPGIKTN